MNEVELMEILNDLLDAINFGNSPRQETVIQYADYIVNKFRDRILNVMS